MESIERQRYGEILVGTTPKVSIDHRIEMWNVHGHQDPAKYVSWSDSAEKAILAFMAAQQILEDLRSAFQYIEVVKISFFWNANDPTGKVHICASAVLVEPLTQKKARVEAVENLGVPAFFHGFQIEVNNERVITSLRQKLNNAMRRQIDVFRGEREKGDQELRRLDSLFVEASVGY